MHGSSPLVIYLVNHCFHLPGKREKKKVYLIDRCRRVGDETSEIDVRKVCMFIFGHAQVSHANTGCTSFFILTVPIWTTVDDQFDMNAITFQGAFPQ